MEWLLILFSTLCAGACIPLGGALARVERLRPRWLETELRHGVMAFGGGVLIAAVAFVLVPEGNAFVDDPLIGVACLLGGGVVFFTCERLLGARRRERPQLTAMLLDYVPESLALGGAFAVGAESALMLALFIGLQNIPEGFNAYRELRSTGREGHAILRFMLWLLPIGPVLALIGWVWLGEHPMLLGGVMVFAAGGILYLVFQDVAPQARMRRHWAPPLGAVAGFAVGMLGMALGA
ncbi:MAG: hypothetical protein LPJ87_10105 [Zoogloeaceae bacterium]|nr:hypothetical protein [Zoogloeaceae bacterium]